MTIRENVDLAGMRPRTVSFDRRSDGTQIVVVVPLNYLRGGSSNRCHDNLRLSINYTMMEERYSNYIDLLRIATVHRDYNESGSWVDMALTDEVVEMVMSAFKYFRYVREHLENNKTDPMLYEPWVANNG